MQDKLARATDKEMNSTISSKSRTMKDVTSIVKNELAIFEVEGKREANLESQYHYHLLAWIHQNVFFQDVKELLPILDHLYMMTAYGVLFGAPQGAVLSPKLFNIFSSDFPTLTDVQLALFPDDSATI
jgi:hypothetical protein